MKSRISRLISSIIAVGLSAGSLFNLNATAPSVNRAPRTTAFVPMSRKGRRYRPAFKTGIKGMASSNNTRYGASLKAHFDAAK